MTANAAAVPLDDSQVNLLRVGKELFAGGAAGTVGIVVGLPFDLIKVRMQVHPDRYRRYVLLSGSTTQG